ncbi:MAG: hypothetical protein M1608_09660 [Candidatus Omnitrophica bacterium]|nr:hypothetical protein [Candidatus Omnitrophota bacterium]
MLPGTNSTESDSPVPPPKKAEKVTFAAKPKGPHARLLDLYAQWRRLTEAEGKAIANGQWPEVNRNQACKEQLKEQIVRATGFWLAKWPNPAQQTAEYDRQIRPILAELVMLESNNYELLDAKCQKARAEQGQLDQSVRNLRGLHRAYVPSEPSLWQSYS